MSGHREDGSYAEDKAHHPNRKVSKGIRMPGPYTGNKFMMAEARDYNDSEDDTMEQAYKGIDPAEMY